MSESLTSVGLDVGTTSTQMILSELEIENRAGSFAVPEMAIQGRKILYKSPVHFTPLLDEARVDADRLRHIVDREYENAGITKAQVDTGAIIITGETSRKENARAVLEALSDYAGDFVVATAGLDLESVLAAKGAGAVEFSERTGKTVLHMDIGGGTANLALIQDGKIMSTGCLNVGGRLVKISPDGRLSYISPVLKGLFAKQVGDYVNREEIRELAQTLVQALEMAAGLRARTELLDALTSEEIGVLPPPLRGTPLINAGGETAAQVISFSGGVADCIETDRGWLAFGDMGPELGLAIRESRLCRGEYILGTETIRATVIGAGCHSAQLSGSTVFHQNMEFPLKNLPVVRRAEHLAQLDGAGVLALEGAASPGYRAVRELAQKLAGAFQDRPVIVAVEQDMAKALGQALALQLGRGAKILCIDRVRLDEGSYLDVGAPVGPAMPVVIKTLILNR
ncbi:MAG: ethanolamine ammonia-lyase reactivating factor EutA [Oscillospiraceae bacterium]|nr:ethanolamine ammonia-lyase reactivating factor EutA [Oscillospiraceae bacterium]